MVRVREEQIRGAANEGVWTEQVRVRAVRQWESREASWMW